MPEETVFEELTTISGITPKAGEKYTAFARRLVSALDNTDKVSDDKFAQLSDGAKQLAEKLHVAIKQRKAMPDMPGYVAAEAPIQEGAKAVETKAPTAEDAVAADAGKKEKPMSKRTKKKPVKAKKSATTKSASKTNGRGRPTRFAAEDKIKILAKGNPKRGTKSKALWKKYREGMTYAEARKAGIPSGDIQYNHDHKLIRVGS